MRTASKSLTKLAAAACLMVASVVPLSASESADGPNLLDALDQDFDAYVATIDAESLRALPPEDAVYMLSQAVDLIDLEADFYADLIQDYAFGGSAKDLDYFMMVAHSASPEFIAAYCAVVSERLSSGILPPDCTFDLTSVFITQYGIGIPKVRYSPYILDALYRLKAEDALVEDGSFADMSGARALRSLELNGDATPQDYIATLGNTALCSPRTKDLAELDLARKLCFEIDPTDEMKAAAAPFPLVNAIVETCEGQESFRRCFRSLYDLSLSSNSCRQPVHRAPIDGWYTSTFFRSCLAAFLRS